MFDIVEWLHYSQLAAAPLYTSKAHSCSAVTRSEASPDLWL
jgi:hypothetical protein